MTLKQLASILPGYVTLYIHSDNQGLRIPAGMVKNHKDLSEATVTRAIPMESYSMEVSIEQKEGSRC